MWLWDNEILNNDIVSIQPKLGHELLNLQWFENTHLIWSSG